MKIENSFTVGAPPDRVFTFLLDVNQVVGCVPGAELADIVDPQNFRGQLRIKVGPIKMAYSGTARIVSRDDAALSTVLEAKGRELAGSGSARATVQMAVTADPPGSKVMIVTDFDVVGRAAQFGRGAMQDVSHRLVEQMAACLRQQLEDSSPPLGLQQKNGQPEVVPPTAVQPSGRLTPASEPIDAGSLLWSITRDRLKTVAGAVTAVGIAIVVLAAIVLLIIRLRGG